MTSRAYAALFVVAVTAAVLITFVGGRRPRARIEPTAAAPAGPPVAVRAEVREGAIVPERTTVPLGSHVTVHARNAGAARHTLVLAGYDDRVAPAQIGPRDSVTFAFVADRPGEDFVWLIDTRPAGVFAVAGSHLVEGHR
jgi:hypothetical protein